MYDLFNDKISEVEALLCLGSSDRLVQWLRAERGYE